MVEDRDGAALGAGGKVIAQPLLLHRSGGERLVAVEHDDMPEAEVRAVPALATNTGLSAPIVVVRRAPRRPRVKRAKRRQRPRLLPAPQLIVAVGIIGKDTGGRVDA